MAKKISIMIDIGAQADQLNRVIEQSKKNIGKIAPGLSDAQTKQFIAQLDQLQKRLASTKADFASGLGSEASFAKAGKDVRRFFEEYSDMISKITEKQIDINKLLPRTEDYNKTIKEQTKNMKEFGEIAAKTYGKAFSPAYQKELKDAIKKGDVDAVKEVNKRAKDDFIKTGKSTIAQASGVKKRLSLTSMDTTAMDEYAKNVLLEYDALPKNSQARQDLARKYSGTGTTRKALEKALKPGSGSAFAQDYQKIVNYETYNKQKINLPADMANAEKAASDIQQLIQPMKELSTVITNLVNTMRGDVQSGLNELSVSEGQVKAQTDEMANAVNNANKEFTEVSAKAKSMQQIKSYFAYFFSAGTIINQLSQAIRGAIRDFSELDKQFNEISIVTGKTMEDLWGQFGNLNNIAQEYGVQTKNVVSVQKLYYQQGRSMADVTRLTGETLKFARISGLDYAEATNYMTASLNAYKIAAEEASKITDVFAALSSTAAVDANEVAVAMSKVASLAAGAGSSFEDTSAYLAKIIETTREAPETAGTALKTIIARFTEVKDLTEEEAALLDEDFNFNNIEKALKTVGVQSKDANGQLRGFSDILNDLGPIWENLTTNQQRYIATAAAGARQQSRFIALMDDWGRTQELQTTAMNSAGLGTKQLALAMDSIETATNRLKSSWQEFYANFLDSGMIKTGINLLNELLNVMNDLIDIPVLGPAIIGTAIVSMVKLVKLAKGFGANFAASFKAGRSAAEKIYNAQRVAEESKNGAKQGIIHSEAYHKAARKIEHIYDEIKKQEDIIQAYENGTARGKAETYAYNQAKRKREGGYKALDDATNEFLNVKSKENPAYGLGKLFGSKGVKDFTKGLNFLGEGGKAFGQNFGAAMQGGKGFGGALKAGFSGGAKTIGGMFTAGGATTAGAVLGGVGIAALLAILIKKAIEAVQAKLEKDMLEATQKTSESISTSVDKITKISNNYTTALELQRKGLTRTEEEMEQYNSSLEELKQTYPQLVKTMSDGTLELAANADSMYSQILEKERENIRQQSDAQYERANKARSLSAGVALSEDAIALQEGIKTSAANLSSLNKDALEDLGLKGIKLKKLNEMAEKGVNRQTLNEATGRSMGIERYEAMIDAMVAGKEGYAYGMYSDTNGNSREWRLMEYYAQQNGQTLQEFARTLKDGAGEKGAAEQEAKALAQSYASEVDTTLSTVVQSGAVKVMQDDKDTGEDKIKAYFQSSKNARQQFEKDIDRILTDMSFEDVQGFDTNLYNFGTEATKFAEATLEEQQKVFYEGLEYQITKYKDATGNVLGEVFKDKDGNITGVDIDGYFKNMSLTEITSYVNTVSQVANKYGQDAATAFENRYKQFRDEVLKGNTELQQAFANTDFFDNESIAKTGAKFIQLTGDYQGFLDVVNKTSDVTDRQFRNLEQFANGVAADIEGLKTSMEQLGDAVDGTLGLEDAIKLIGKSGGSLSMSDFTATSKGFQLSQEKALQIRTKILEVQVNQYKLEMALNKAKLENAKNELIAELDKVKIKELANTLDYNQAEIKEAINKLDKAKLEQLLAAIKLREIEGQQLSAEAQMMYDILEAAGKSVSLFEMVNLQDVIPEGEIQSIINHVSQLTFEFDTANTAIGRTINKLEKLLDLLAKVDFYSDINAYLDDLQLKIDSLDFTIEFTSNAETFAEATKDKLMLMNEQISANLAKSNKAGEQAAAYRSNLETEWGQYVNFDKEGNLLTNGNAITQWSKRIADMAASQEEAVKQQAEQEEKRLEMLLDQIDAYRKEKKLIAESKNEAKKLLQETEKLTNELRQNVVDMEEKFFDLFVQRDEEILENLEKRYEKMKEMDDEYLDSVRDAIDEERRLRDQSKAYEDVAQMERRLALLQMGGGSAVEIQKLQEDIKQARQDITDTEQDNILDGIEKENEARAEAMDEEVEYQRAVLEQKKEDRRLYNEEIKILMRQDKETIMNTWKALDKEWLTATEVNKALMETNMNNLLKSGLGSAKSLADDGIKLIENAFIDVKNKGIDEVDSAMDTYVNTVSVGSDGAVSSIKKIEQAYFDAAADAKELVEWQTELNKQLGITIETQKNNSKYNIDPNDIPKETRTLKAKKVSGQNYVVGYSQNTKTGKENGYVLGEDGEYYDIFNSKGLEYDYVTGELTITDPTKVITGDYQTLHTNEIRGSASSDKKIPVYEEDGSLRLTLYNGNTLGRGTVKGYKQNLVDGKRLYKINLDSGGDIWLDQAHTNEIIGNKDTTTQLWRQFRLKQFARGGMVDFTGPAWVDGTKSHPEAFLSANDTQLIASLRDILRAGISPTAFAATTPQKGGDTYYTIHINVDELGDGYSVDDLVEEMEQRILEATGQNGVVKLK